MKRWLAAIVFGGLGGAIVFLVTVLLNIKAKRRAEDLRELYDSIPFSFSEDNTHTGPDHSNSGPSRSFKHELISSGEIKAVEDEGNILNEQQEAKASEELAGTWMFVFKSSAKIEADNG